MSSRGHPLRCSLLALLLAAGAASAPAVTVSVTDLTSTFSVLEGMNGQPLTDLLSDQQTGQKSDDYVTNGASSYYGFLMKFGQIGGVDSLVFRLRLDEIRTKSGNPDFQGYAKIGIDANGDGAVDIYLGVNDSGNSAGSIVYQNPSQTGGTYNTSPSTSSLGSEYGSVAASAGNYSYTGVDDGSALNGTPDAMLTFATPFTTLQTNLSNLGIAITQNSLLRFVAFTATNNNSVNQDVYGNPGDLSLSYSAAGFTNYYSADGKVIPEPATWLQLAGLLAAPIAAFVVRRRRSRRPQ